MTMMTIQRLAVLSVTLALHRAAALVFVKTANGMEQRDFDSVSSYSSSSSRSFAGGSTRVGATRTSGVGIAVPQPAEQSSSERSAMATQKNSGLSTRQIRGRTEPRFPYTHYRENVGGYYPDQSYYFNQPRNRYFDGSWPPPESIVQGGSRRTFGGGYYGGSSYYDPYYNGYFGNGVSTYNPTGRPVSGTVEWWENPSSSTARVRTYSMHGRPIQTSMMGSRNAYNYPGTVSVRNSGPMAFPMSVSTSQAYPSTTSSYASTSQPGSFAGGYGLGGTTTIQGGNSLRTFPVDPSVDRVQVVLSSESWMPVQAVIELWQGPNNVQQLAEVYTEDGRPFSAVFETRNAYNYGGSSTIAIKNTGPTTFPIQASVRKYF